jgi:Zn-dependent protease with chaperone function
MTRRAFLYPAMLVPFLGSAYSRACEYTCDRIGGALEPEGGIDGLLVLASGKELYSKMSAVEFSRQTETERGFFVRFAEIVSSHPHLTKRVAVLDSLPKREPAPPRHAPPETFAPPDTPRSR